jgi:hypothetical protein
MRLAGSHSTLTGKARSHFSKLSSADLCVAEYLCSENITAMTEMREVRLPAELCAAAEKKFARKFSTLEELLTFILRDLSRDDALQLDHAEQRIIEERLRELGYI